MKILEKKPEVIFNTFRMLESVVRVFGNLAWVCYLGSKDLQQLDNGCEYAWGVRSLCTWTVFGDFGQYTNKDNELLKCSLLE